MDDGRDCLVAAAHKDERDDQHQCTQSGDGPAAERGPEGLDGLWPVEQPCFLLLLGGIGRTPLAI